VLIGIYELRLGDAQLPSTKTDEAFALVGVDRNAAPIELGRNVLIVTVRCLIEIGDVVIAVNGDDNA